MPEALLGGLGGQEQGPKLPRRRTEQRLQVGDRIDGSGDVGPEQAQCAERVEPRRNQMRAPE